TALGRIDWEPDGDQLLDLSSTDLRGFNLTRVRFAKNAYLRDANLDYAILRSANLNRATLMCAHLAHANLDDANLEHADLTGAYLADATMACAQLRGAKLNPSRGLTQDQIDRA